MAKQLILDTSAKYLVVALAENEKIIDKIQYIAWQRQSEFTALEIQNILKRNHTTMREIKRIIVSNGPGSYTGVRIALTLAKVFAISLNIPLCVLSSLQAMCGVKTKQIALLDARSKRAYVGLYDKGIKLRDDFVCGLDELESLLKKHPDFEVVGDRFLVGLPEQEIAFPEQMLALSKLVEDHPDVDALVPVYLKEIL